MNQDSRCAYRDSSGHLPAKFRRVIAGAGLVGYNERAKIRFVLSGNQNLVALFVGPDTTLTELKNQMEHETGYSEQWRTDGGLVGSNTPPPEIPKALQNRAELNPIVKSDKNC